MTANELSAARRTLGLTRVQMAMQLETAYPTYRDWERGVNRIPGVCKVAVDGLLYRDRLFMENIKNSITNKKCHVLPDRVHKIC